MSRLQEDIELAQSLRRAGRATRSIAQLMGKSATWVDQHAPDLRHDNAEPTPPKSEPAIVSAPGSVDRGAARTALAQLERIRPPAKPGGGLPLRPRDYSDADWIEHLEAAIADMRRQMDEALGVDLAPQLQVSLGLTAQESRLLAYLWRRAPMVASKGAVLAALTDPDDIDGGPEPKIVDVVVCKLRNKLETLRSCIETVWGQGYRLNSEGRRRLNTILGLPG